MDFRLMTIILLIALAGLASPSNCDEVGNTYAQTCGMESFDDCGNATAFIVVALALVAFAIGLTYMYAKLKQDARTEMWAKDEASNLVITVFLFVGLIAVFQASCAIVSETVGANPFDATDAYLERLASANGFNVIRTLTFESLNNQMDATKYIYIGLAPFYGEGVALDANRKAWSAHKEMVIDLYLPILASLNAQKFALRVIQWVGASLVLPFAFVMRIIPATRDFGNVLIAIFFVAYIAVPFMYVSSYHAYSRIASDPLPCVSCPDQVHNFYSYGLDGSTGAGLDEKNAVFYKIGITIPQAVFIPNIVAIVGITCIMALSKALKALAV